MSERPALLLVAHGTRDPRGAQEMDALTALLRDRLGAPVAHAWLEDFAEPHVGATVDALVARGVERIVSLPLLTLGAGHAKT
ncbi:MAG: sirohydrochlorin chelatase, partial [Pseudonocardiaceae bacterium]